MARDPLVLAEEPSSWTADGGALDPLVGPQCSLAVQLRRATGAVIGRTAELDAIAQGIRESAGRLSAVTLEGEPGIGKTRLLLEAAELAASSGFTCVAITADEEIRGPFLVARSLFASTALRDAVAGTPAELAVRRVVEAISGRDERGYETLSATNGSEALEKVAAERPDMILLDVMMPLMDGLAACRRLKESDEYHDRVSWAKVKLQSRL